jgi:hypothetical protein
VDAQKFLELINHPENITFEDLKQLEEFAKKYPFAQSSYALIAKANSLLDPETAKLKINQAAIYTVNRGVLKRFILATPLVENDTHTQTIQPAEESSSNLKPEETLSEINKVDKPKKKKQTKPSSKQRKKTKHEDSITSQQDKTETSTPEIQNENQVLEEVNNESDTTDTKDSPSIQKSETVHEIPEQKEEEETADLEEIKTSIIQKAQQLEKEIEEEINNISQTEETDKLEEVEEKPRAKTKKEHQKSPKTYNLDTIEVARKKKTETSITYEPDLDDMESDDFYKEIRENLERLKKQKENFIQESIEKEAENKAASQNSDTNPVKAIVNESSHMDGSAPDEDLILNSLSPSQDKDNKETFHPKQKEQFDLIDKFIEMNHRLSRLQPNINHNQEEQEDLSVKYTEIGDHLISENLANIMIKQNKVEKAIDIYKKLIWKFPQKKAYFANRIEELKNK